MAVFRVCVCVCVCTFVAVIMVCPVEVVDGVHRMELDLCEISLADPLELRGGLGGGRPRHSLLRFRGLTDNQTVQTLHELTPSIHSMSF